MFKAHQGRRALRADAAFFRYPQKRLPDGSREGCQGIYPDYPALLLIECGRQALLQMPHYKHRNGTVGVTLAGGRKSGAVV